MRPFKNHKSKNILREGERKKQTTSTTKKKNPKHLAMALILTNVSTWKEFPLHYWLIFVLLAALTSAICTNSLTNIIWLLIQTHFVRHYDDLIAMRRHDGTTLLTGGKINCHNQCIFHVPSRLCSVLKEGILIVSIHFVLYKSDTRKS